MPAVTAGIIQATTTTPPTRTRIHGAARISSEASTVPTTTTPTIDPTMKNAVSPERTPKLGVRLQSVEIRMPGEAPLDGGRADQREVGEPEVDRVPHGDEKEDDEQRERRRTA